MVGGYGDGTELAYEAVRGERGGEGEGGMQLLICSPSPGPVHYTDDFGTEDGTIWHHPHYLPLFLLPH